MIAITGAAGFIGSNLAQALQQTHELLLVDDFTDEHKAANFLNLKGLRIDRNLFADWLLENPGEVDFIFHLGARTDTTEFNFRVLDSLNTSYSKVLWEIAATRGIPMVYASSAATYGMGEWGFDDNESLVPQLKPLNPYGLSKQLFDVHVLQSVARPPFWAGLKFFNVYGPHENHKGRMASVIFHAWKQIRETGKLHLFESHRSDFVHGGQLRDFIHVNDVVAVCCFFLENRKTSGIFNVGTGKARSFNDLAAAVFSAMKRDAVVDYIPTPLDIRDKYQYFTEAKMEKLKSAGYRSGFLPLEEGVNSYIAWLENGRENG